MTPRCTTSTPYGRIGPRQTTVRHVKTQFLDTSLDTSNKVCRNPLQGSAGWHIMRPMSEAEELQFLAQGLRKASAFDSAAAHTKLARRSKPCSRSCTRAADRRARRLCTLLPAPGKRNLFLVPADAKHDTGGVAEVVLSRVPEIRGQIIELSQADG